MLTHRRFLCGVALSVLMVSLPATASELDDQILRGSTAAVDAPAAAEAAALERAEIAIELAATTTWALANNQPVCAPASLDFYAHKTQVNAELVILPARDVNAGHGYCVEPTLNSGSWEVQMCTGTFKLNTVTKRFDILLWSFCGDAIQSVAGHGTAYVVATHNYGTNVFPTSWLQGCVWYKLPKDGLGSRTCSAPIPALA